MVNASPASRPADDESYRLPRTVLPRRYHLRLAPDLASASFRGEETIDLQVQEPVREIVLNVAELTIERVELTDGQRTLRGTARLDEALERATLLFEETISPGTWQLRLAFAGTLNARLRGFYLSSFRDQEGAEQRIAATQFESTDARRAFPCWDEPDLKATFAVTLVVPEELLAISNGPVVREEPLGDGRKAVHFAETIPMSTYLVAFVVGPFEATEAVMVRGVPLRVVAPRGKLALTRYALRVGAFALEFFADYFGIPYPAAKLDLIAIPDFAFGAMENLGAVTFRETALLVDEQAASQPELQRIADVVAHELAHMWFGDLVTMRWWNGIWLNEAFATFMEMVAVAAWKPEWKRWESFAIERSGALMIDALASTRAVEYPVRWPAEAAEMFDVLTYQKGASVLRMLEQYLGPERFMAGIRRYLTKHAYANAETTDLWDALEEATSEPVRRIMDGWIFQPGFPLVTVERTEQGIRLSQRLFRLDRSDDGRRWDVPVLLRAERGGEQILHKVLLRDRSLELALDRPERVVVNSGGSGFYRVRYEGDLGTALQAAIFSLSPVERFQLVDDTFAAALAGLASAADLLQVAEALVEERDRNVWDAVLSSLAFLHRVAEPELRPRVRARIRAILRPRASALGWDSQPGESELDRALRGQLLQALGTIGDDGEVRQVARERYARYLEAPSSLDPNLVTPVVEILAYTGDGSRYEEFVQRYRTARTPQEELRYLMALPLFRDRDLAARTLAMTLSGEVRTQNAAFVINRQLLNLETSNLAWEFITSHWQTIVETLPANLVPRAVSALATLADPAVAEAAQHFFVSAPLKEGRKQIEQTLELQAAAVAFRQREAERLRALFAAA
jgi:puromycin-sensitive aminopeptidase